jgi:hypothetical protein
MSESDQKDVNPSVPPVDHQTIVTAENPRRSSSTDKLDLVAPAHKRTLAFNYSAGDVIGKSISDRPDLHHRNTLTPPRRECERPPGGSSVTPPVQQRKS